jgi:hypothetical protein
MNNDESSNSDELNEHRQGHDVGAAGTRRSTENRNAVAGIEGQVSIQQ